MRKLTKEECIATWAKVPTGGLMEALMDKMLEVNAEEAKDAARYRWLSSYLISDDQTHDDAIVACRTEEQLTAAIDAAMKGTP